MSSFPDNPVAARMLVRGLTLLLAAGAAPLAVAAEYSVTPKVRQDFRYDDNFQLVRDAQDILTYEIETAAVFERKTEHLTLTADLEVGFERYADTSFDRNLPPPDASPEDFDSDNQRAELSAEWTGIKNSLVGSLGLVRDSTLTSEFDNAGVISRQQAQRRELAQFSGTWRHLLTQRLSLSISGRYQDAVYDAEFFNDFQYGFLQFGLTQALTERISIDYTVYGSWFGTDPRESTYLEGNLVNIFGQPIVFPTGNVLLDPFELSNTTVTFAGQVGVTRFFTENMRGTLRVGYRDAELKNDRRVVAPPFEDVCVFGGFAFCEGTEVRSSQTQSGFIGSAEISYAREYNDFSARLDFQDRPSPQGLLEARTLTLNWRRQLLEHLTFSLELRAQQSEVIRGVAVEDGTAFGFFGRDFARVAPRLQWRFSENWVFGTGMQYRAQRAELPPGTQDLNPDDRTNNSFAVVLSLDYLPGRQRLN